MNAVFGPLSNIAAATTLAVAPPPVASVMVNPSTATVVVGQSVQLSATLRDAGGNVVTGRTVTWASSNQTAIQVSGNGLANAVTPGTATVSASSEGATGQSIITSVSGGGGTGQAWFLDDFSSYNSTAELITTGGSRNYTQFYAEDGGSVVLDQSSGVNIDGLNLSKSMRFSYPDMTSWTNDVRVRNGVADRCDNYVIRPTLVPNGQAFRSKRHLWFEAYVKFQTNWTTEPPASWNCPGAGGNDHKTWLILVYPQGAVQSATGNNRWEVKIGAGRGGPGPAVKVGDPVSGQNQFPNLKSWLNNDPEAIAPTYWDGRWHRIRVEAGLGTPGAANGVFRVWMDNTLIHQRTNLNFPAVATGFDAMNLGSNRNHGTGVQTSWSWGLIRIYDQNPGW